MSLLGAVSPGRRQTMNWTFSAGFPDNLSGRSALVGSAIVVFLTGTAVYLLGRDWTTTLFLTPVSAWQPEFHVSFGFLGASLPSLCHAYAFTLLIILALWPARHARLAGAFSWLLVASALECLQAEAISDVVAAGTGWFAGNPLVDGVLAYMMNGHFDVADLAATAVGVAAAFVATSILERKT
mgnify:CR=1 FL=1